MATGDPTPGKPNPERGAGSDARPISSWRETEGEGFSESGKPESHIANLRIKKGKCMYTQKEVDQMIQLAIEQYSEKSKQKGGNAMDETLKSMTDRDLEMGIDALLMKKSRIERHARLEGRALDVEETSWINDAEKYVREYREELQMRKPERPLTVVDGPLGGGMSHGFDHSRDLGMPVKDKTFRGMFGYPKSQKLNTGGFKDCAEFLDAVWSGRYDPRLVRASANETTPSQGGFAVPEGFSSEWLDASLPNELIRNLCRVFPMTTETLPIPGWDAADMSAGATHGGFTMEFMAEGSTATPQTPKLRKIMLTARVGGIYCDASLELVADGTNFERNLQTALVKSIGYGLDRFGIAGTGAGCPQGFLNAPCKIVVAKESGQRMDTLVYQNLKKMFARQLNPQDAVWLFNATAIPELLEQSVAVGTGGNFVPLLNESNGKFNIFGRPAYFHPAMPTLGDAGDAAFVDFNFYALGLRKEVGIDISDAPRWLQRERSFRILIRFDGQCTLDKAVTPEHGDSLSPVVTLAERA